MQPWARPCAPSTVAFNFALKFRNAAGPGDFLDNDFMSRVVQRQAFEVEDLVLDFPTVAAAAEGPEGSIRIQNIDSNPALGALRDGTS